MIPRVQVTYPIASMYDIFTYIWLIFMVNVGKYTIHGCYGYDRYGCYLLFVLGNDPPDRDESSAKADFLMEKTRSDDTVFSEETALGCSFFICTAVT